jgi:hypothetical protein
VVLIGALLLLWVELFLIIGVYENITEFSDPLGARLGVALAVAPAAVALYRATCRRRAHQPSLIETLGAAFAAVICLAAVVVLLLSPI